jgi:hypothetical protein
MSIGTTADCTAAPGVSRSRTVKVTLCRLLETRADDVIAAAHLDVDVRGTTW